MLYEKHLENLPLLAGRMGLRVFRLYFPNKPLNFWVDLAFTKDHRLHGACFPVEAISQGEETLSPLVSVSRWPWRVRQIPAQDQIRTARQGDPLGCECGQFIREASGGSRAQDQTRRSHRGLPQPRHAPGQGPANTQRPAQTTPLFTTKCFIRKS